MNWGKVKKAVIPAAGMGTRFLPITKSIPKEMLPILDKPAIQFIVEEAIASGIKDILVIVSYWKNSIIDHFDYSFELEERLKISGKMKEYNTIRQIADMASVLFVRQKEPLGLGHAILAAKNFIGNEPFAVLLGDDIVIQKNPNDSPALKQCIDLFNQKQTSIVGIQEVAFSEVNKYGIVEPDGPIDFKNKSVKLKGMIEKPDPSKSPSNYAILGRYVLTPSIFTEIEKSKVSTRGEIEITDSLLNLSQKEGVYAKIFSGRRYDIGSKLGFLEATIDISLTYPELKDSLIKYMQEMVEKSKKNH